MESQRQPGERDGAVDAKTFLENFQDYLAPKLDTYEQALYLYIVRHSRFVGRDDVVIGFKSARLKTAFGIGKAGTPMSEAVCYEKLRSLERKGCLTLVASERSGTRVSVRLPDEIAGVMPAERQPGFLTTEEMDFFNVPENRALILRREAGRCFYCLRQISDDTYVVEHVVSRPNGDNTYKNVVAACRQCNNKKGRSLAEDFLRRLYREGILSESELGDRIENLRLLRTGELRPAVPERTSTGA